MTSGSTFLRAYLSASVYSRSYGYLERHSGARSLSPVYMRSYHLSCSVLVWSCHRSWTIISGSTGLQGERPYPRKSVVTQHFFVGKNVFSLHFFADNRSRTRARSCLEKGLEKFIRSHKCSKIVVKAREIYGRYRYDI